MTLNEIVLDAADQLWERVACFGSRVVAQVPEAECVATGDRMMLTRAVANLIDNALKYGPAHSDVHCTLRADGGAWLIAVEDAAVGIAPARRAAAAGAVNAPALRAARGVAYNARFGDGMPPLTAGCPADDACAFLGLRRS